jgi:hypothetical protein
MVGGQPAQVLERIRQVRRLPRDDPIGQAAGDKDPRPQDKTHDQSHEQDTDQNGQNIERRDQQSGQGDKTNAAQDHPARVGHAETETTGRMEWRNAGMMEYWNGGILGIRHAVVPLFGGSILLFHHSAIPTFQYSILPRGSDRHLDVADDLRDDLPRTRTAVAGLRGQDHPVRQHMRRAPEHIVRNHVVTVLEIRPRLGRP